MTKLHEASSFAVRLYKWTSCPNPASSGKGLSASGRKFGSALLENMHFLEMRTIAVYGTAVAVTIEEGAFV
jgi:hypothetical protein